MSRVKILFTLALLTLFSVMFTACNKERNVEALVIRDCTGVYLRVDGVDFRVCNDEKAENIVDGEKVQVTFKKCNNPDESGPVCMLYHPYESDIELCEIE